MTDLDLPAESCEALTTAPSPSVPMVLASWSCCAHAPGALVDPSLLGSANADWMPAEVPGTVASALRACGKWDFQRPVELDAQDWWYRTRFSAPARPLREPCVLCFDGLATLAEVWLNGERILTTDNMFRSYRVDVAAKLQSENELVICFRSLTADLKKRRPRPRWKTNLVSSQQLRWERTSLLGRIPGWTPPVPAVGPWREVRLECQSVLLRDVQRTTALVDGNGIVSFQARVDASVAITGARLLVGDEEALLEWQRDGESISLHGSLKIKSPALWWPHTHGEPALLDCQVVIDIESEPSGKATHPFPLSRIGFRKIEIQNEPGFAIHVNDVPVYCRGACWTTNDIFTLSGTEESLKRDLLLARDAGMNMLRVGGTMTYESDTFYRLCDELGILVWQDFMFANMDYPVDDEAFAQNIALEAAQQLDRLAPHPCVVMYCGNSEIEQQAAMLGMPRELWRNRWFGEFLPLLCRERHPGAAYVPSTPSGGVLPFHVKTGITHYYGVGAYLRSTGDLRQADVKFTSECLGFANLPEPEVIDEFMGDLLPVAHHPLWKQRVPRDTGAGWDFEDVRDHYLRALFNVDPVSQRWADMSRYMQLSRLVSGEMMARTFAEWRGGHSRNAGGLVWFFKDLWAATGWGIVDHRGVPKPAYYQVKRAWQTRQLTVTDEGLDGLHLHLVNEARTAQEGFVEVLLLREPNVVLARQEVAVTVNSRSQQTLSADAILGAFYDLTNAYRFGPQYNQVVIATWFNTEREVISESVHLARPRDPEAQPLSAEMLQASFELLAEGSFQLVLKSDRLLHGMRLSAKGFLPDDNYFYLAPARSKTVTFSPTAKVRGTARVVVEALNIMGELSVEVK